MHRMSLREVQEVARLAADNGTPIRGGGPTVHGVADALGLPPTEVELLLDQARQGRSPIRDFKIVAGIAALIVAFMIGLGTTTLVGRHTAPAAVANSAEGTPTIGGTMRPVSEGSVAEVARTASPGTPVASNEAPSQLSGQGAPLEVKTTDGDVRRAVEMARHRSGPVVQSGNGNDGPRRMMTTALTQ